MYKPTEAQPNLKKQLVFKNVPHTQWRVANIIGEGNRTRGLAKPLDHLQLAKVASEQIAGEETAGLGVIVTALVRRF